MLGLMLMEIESFKESKQTSGYGVDLQKDLMEDKWGLRELVVEEEEEEELWRALVVVVKKIMQRSRSCKSTFGMEEAIAHWSN